jgi:hypothetical protein
MVEPRRAFIVWIDSRTESQPEVPTNSEAGVTLIEMLISVVLVLIIMLGVCSFMESNKRQYQAVNQLTTATSSGRSALEIFSTEVRVAGYSPLGASFDAVPFGSATRVQLLADLDEDGVVGTATEDDENITYEFLDPEVDGVYDLVRGIDLNGDGDYVDTDESVDTIIENVVAIDLDDDGTDEAFLIYDAPAPATTRIEITFGVRTQRRHDLKSDYQVVEFKTEVNLKNKI